MNDKLYVISFEKNYLKPQSRDKSVSDCQKQYFKFYSVSQKISEHIDTASESDKLFSRSVFQYIYTYNKNFIFMDNGIFISNINQCFFDSEIFFEYFTKNILIIPKNMIPDFSLKYFKQLFKLLCSWLKYADNIPSVFKNYFTRLYFCLSSEHPLYKVFINPNDFFFFINKEIMFYNPYLKSYVHGLFLLQHLKQYRCNINKMAKIIRDLSKICSQENFYTSSPDCISNYSFYFLYGQQSYYACFTPEGISYAKNTNQRLPDFLRKNIKHAANLNSQKNIGLSDNCVELLYSLSGGIKQNLDNFAVVSAIILSNYYSNIRYTLPSKNCSPLSLFIIFSSGQYLQYIQYMLQTILFANPSMDTEIVELKEITHKKYLLSLLPVISSIGNGYIPVKPSKTPLTEKQTDTLNKLIQRKEIIIQDNHLKHCFSNHLPLICFADNQQDLKSLNAVFKTKTFSFKEPPFQPFYQGGITTSERASLAALLTVYGLKIIYSQNFKIRREKRRPESENIITQFIEDCLTIHPSGELYADSLYEFYCNYYRLLYTGKPMSKIVFTKELRKSLPCEYKKPRHSRSDNKYAFIGVAIDKKKALRFVDGSNTALPKSCEKESFSAYLDEIQTDVNSIFQTLIAKLQDE